LLQRRLKQVMRFSLPLAEVTLSLALSGLAVAAIVSVRRRDPPSQLSIRAQFTAGTPGLRDLGGLDIRGKGVGFPARRPGTRFITFVIRAASVEADCRYWNAVSSRIAGSAPARQIRLAAFCDSARCANAAGDLAEFPVIAFAENDVLLRAQKLDRGAYALEIDARGHARETFRWRGVPPSTTAARLMRFQ